MEPSTAKTYDVPDGTQSNNPAPIAMGTGVPVRAIVRNVGPNVLVLGFSASDVIQTTGGQSSSTYRIPPGDREVIVLGPKDKLYAMGIGFGGRISVIQSDAFPTL